MALNYYYKLNRRLLSILRKNMATWETAVSVIASTKIVGYLGAVAFFEYLWIPGTQLWILTILMAIDFATGIWKQWRIDSSKITSHEAWLWATKKIATMISILSVALILKGLELDSTAWIKGMIGIYIMAEWYSVIQNIYAVRTGTILPEYDVISIVIKKIGETIKESIDNSVTKK